MWMRSSNAVEARPLRTVLNSVRVAATALAMRSVALSSSSFSTSHAPLLARQMGAHHSAHTLAGQDAFDVLAGHLENVDRQPVVHAQRQRGGVHHLEPALDSLKMRDLGDEARLWHLFRVGVVDAVVFALGHE